WLGCSGERRRALRATVLAIGLLFGTTAMLLLLFYGACWRYETEFLAPLGLLAVVGLFGLGHPLTPQRWWRRAAPGTWSVLLTATLATTALCACNRRSAELSHLGKYYLDAGDPQKAITYFTKALRWRPEFIDAEGGLAMAFAAIGEKDRAIEEF